jgi:hypothetical protein
LSEKSVIGTSHHSSIGGGGSTRQASAERAQGRPSGPPPQPDISKIEKYIPEVFTNRFTMEFTSRAIAPLMAVIRTFL